MALHLRCKCGLCANELVCCLCGVAASTYCDQPSEAGGAMLCVGADSMEAARLVVCPRN